MHLFPSSRFLPLDLTNNSFSQVNRTVNPIPTCNETPSHSHSHTLTLTLTPKPTTPFSPSTHSTTSTPSPTHPPPQPDVGNVFGWGWDSHGQVGLDYISPKGSVWSTPVPLAPLLCYDTSELVSSGVSQQVATRFSFILDRNGFGSTTRDGYLDGFYLVITSGRGVGQVRRIKTHDAQAVSVELETAFDLCALPLSGTRYEIRESCPRIAMAAIDTGFTHTVALDS